MPPTVATVRETGMVVAAMAGGREENGDAITRRTSQDGQRRLRWTVTGEESEGGGERRLGAIRGHRRVHVHGQAGRMNEGVKARTGRGLDGAAPCTQRAPAPRVCDWFLRHWQPAALSRPAPPRAHTQLSPSLLAAAAVLAGGIPTAPTHGMATKAQS